MLPLTPAPAPAQIAEDTVQGDESHADPASPNAYLEFLRAICDEILDHRLAPPLHLNSQAIPALHGMLEDVIARISRMEASNRSYCATEQQQKLFAQVMNLLRQAESIVADKQSAVREQSDHHDQAPKHEADFTDD